MWFQKIDTSGTVLLVEDESYIAADLEQMLAELGFGSVTVCQTYSSAKLAVAQGGYDLAVFDINVGGLLSYELISKIIRQKTPIVSISGYVTGVDQFDGRVFLSKPIDRRRLARAISHAQSACIPTATEATSDESASG